MILKYEIKKEDITKTIKQFEKKYDIPQNSRERERERERESN